MVWEQPQACPWAPGRRQGPRYGSHSYARGPSGGRRRPPRGRSYGSHLKPAGARGASRGISHSSARGAAGGLRSGRSHSYALGPGWARRRDRPGPRYKPEGRPPGPAGRGAMVEARRASGMVEAIATPARGPGMGAISSPRGQGGVRAVWEPDREPAGARGGLGGPGRSETARIRWIRSGKPGSRRCAVRGAQGPRPLPGNPQGPSSRAYSGLGEPLDKPQGPGARRLRTRYIYRDRQGAAKCRRPGIYRGLS